MVLPGKTCSTCANNCCSSFVSSPSIAFASQTAKFDSSSLKKRNPEFPQKQLVIGDFFEHVGKYDLIIEQTLFCALNPSLRSQYAEKTAELLCENGKLVGLLFNRDFVGGPPFGGNKEEYLGYFQNHFSTVEMNECKNSIAPRQGTELFINLVK